MAHARTVYRVAYGFLGRAADAEDATQEAFMRYMRTDMAFDSDEHVRAWLIRVVSNLCRDVLKSAEVARRDAGAEEVPEAGATPLASGSIALAASPEEQHDETLAAVLELEPKYRDVVYLYYYEGYTAARVAEIVGKPPSTVRNLLSEARGILKKRLGGEWR